MINSKITKSIQQQSSEEKLFKLLESIDWKLWEMYNILKDQVPEKTKPSTTAKTKTTKKTEE
jgi:hypothetical protein